MGRADALMARLRADFGPSDSEPAGVVLPQPPFGCAPGPQSGQEEVLEAFARDERAGHSEHFHVEGRALMADGDTPAALRIGPGTVMVRGDLPEELVYLRQPLEAALGGAGLACLDNESLLAAPVALQILGIRLSTWDLWGRDIDYSFAALRRAAVGEQALPPW